MAFDSNKALVLLILALVVSLPLMFVYTGVSSFEAFVAFLLVLAVADFSGLISLVGFVRSYLNPTKTIGGSFGGSNKWVFSSPMIVLVSGLYCANSVSKIMSGSAFEGFYG